MNDKNTLLNEIAYDTRHDFIEWKIKNKKQFTAYYSEQLTPLKSIHYVLVYNNRNAFDSKMYVYFEKRDHKNVIISNDLLLMLGGEENRYEVRRINIMVIDILSKEEANNAGKTSTKNDVEKIPIKNDEVRFKKGDRVEVCNLSYNDFDERLLNEKGTVIKELYYYERELFYLIEFDNDIAPDEMVSVNFDFDQLHSSTDSIEKGNCWPIRPEDLEKI